LMLKAITDVLVNQPRIQVVGTACPGYLSYPPGLINITLLPFLCETNQANNS